VDADGVGNERGNGNRNTNDPGHINVVGDVGAQGNDDQGDDQIPDLVDSYGEEETTPLDSEVIEYILGYMVQADASRVA
jgi:hypothetical protein